MPTSVPYLKFKADIFGSKDNQQEYPQLVSPNEVPQDILDLYPDSVGDGYTPNQQYYSAASVPLAQASTSPSEFDMDTYLAKQLGDSGLNAPIASKRVNLAEASARKLKGMEDYRQDLVERKRAYDASVIGKLGLNPDGLIGATVNEAVRFGADIYAPKPTSKSVDHLNSVNAAVDGLPSELIDASSNLAPSEYETNRLGFNLPAWEQARENILNRQVTTPLTGQRTGGETLAELHRLRTEATPSLEDQLFRGSIYTPPAKTPPGFSNVDPGPLELAASSVSRATAGIGKLLTLIPESAVRMVDGLAEAADKVGSAMGIPAEMMDRKYLAPHDIIKPLARGFDVGGFKVGGMNDLGYGIEKFGEFFQTKESMDKMADVDKQAAVVVKQVGNGDFSGLVDILSAPEAWNYYAPAAIPSLYAAAVGGLPMMFGMALGEGTDNVLEYESDPKNTKASDINNALAIAQSASLNTLLEKIGVSAVFKKLPESVQGKIVSTASENLTSSLGNITKRVGAGALGEGATELSQNTVANASMKMYVDPNQELLEGAIGSVMGGLGAGGTVSGAVQTLGEITRSTPEHAAKAQKDVEASASFQEAVVKNDTSVYLDKDNPAYDPSAAVRVLFGNSQQEATTPEAKQENLTQATAIVQDMEEVHEGLRQRIEDSKPEGITRLEGELEAAKAMLAPRADVADPASTTKLEDKVKDLELEIKDAQADAKIHKTLESRFAKMDRQLSTAREVKDNLGVLVNPKPEAEVSAADVPMSTATPEVKAEAQAATGRVINLSMASPNQVTPDQAKQLADNAQNAMATPQRDYLRAFSAARIAENTVKGNSRVSQEIYAGNPKTNQVGIVQHRQRIASALSRSNQESADNHLATLRNFAVAHTNKAAVAAQALALAKSTETMQQVQKTDTGWIVAEGKPMGEIARKRNGGFNVRHTGDARVQEFATESAALNAVLAEMQAAYSMTFQAQSTVATPVEATITVVPEVPVVNSVDSVELSTTPVDTESTTVETPQPPLEQTDSTPVQAEVEIEPTGKLQAIAEKAKEGLGYKGKRIGDFFTQSSKREGDVTQRPLVAVKDFLSQVRAGTAKITDFLTEPKNGFTDKQRGVIQAFAAKAKAWSPIIQKELRKTNADYQHQNMIEMLVQVLDTDGVQSLQLEENVITALAYAGFSYTAENATRPTYNTKEDINNILGREEDAYVSSTEETLLGTAGTRQAVVANTIGQKVLQALGFKARKDAPLDTQSKLESSLGMAVVKMLITEGILERKTITGKEMAAMTKSADTDTNALQHFLAIKRVANFDLPQQTVDIHTATKGSQGALDKLFGVESGLKDPGLEPSTQVQEYAKNSLMRVPKRLRKIVKKLQAVPWKVRQDSLQLLGQIDRENVLSMMGVVNLDTDPVHIDDQAGALAKNDALIREYDNFMDYVTSTLGKTAEDLGQSFFLEYSTWKQQRVGIATTSVNPQSSKIVRRLVTPEAWESTVSMDDTDNFYLRVAEGFGYATDKKYSETVLKDFKDTLPGLAPVIEIVRKAVQEGGGIPKEDQTTLRDAVAAGGENFHTLDAIIALASHAQAVIDGKTEFTTSIMGEVDGVTNGPMLSHLLLGAANTVKGMYSLLNRGGFYEAGNPNKYFNRWKGDTASKNLDIYEKTTESFDAAAKAMAASDPAGMGVVLGHIYNIIGELRDNTGKVTSTGRNIIKTPLTSLIFGSSLTTSKANMAEKFVEDIRGQIAKLAKDGPTAVTTSIIASINALMAYSDNRLTAIPAMPISALLTRSFSEREMDALRSSFTNTLGEAIEVTLSEDFAVYLDRRKTLNETAQLAYGLYDAAYTGIREDFIAQDKSIERSPKGVATHDITRSQEEALQVEVAALAPVMHSAFSSESGELDAGLHMSKTKTKLSTRPEYKSETRFKSDIDDPKTKSTKISGNEVVGEGPGVGTSVLSTHSDDSANLHKTMEEFTSTLGIHDAIGDGLATGHDSAVALNRNTWETTLNYSPANEVYLALARSMFGLEALLSKRTPSQTVLNNLVKEIKKQAKKHKVAPETFLNHQLHRAKSLAYTADKMKFEAMAEMAAVSQYAKEGASFEVKPEHRAEAKKRGEALTPDVAASVLKSLDAVSAILAPHFAGVATPTTPVAADLDSSITDAPILGFAPARAMQLLDHGRKDESLDQSTRDQMDAILNEMVTSKEGLKTAVLTTLSIEDAPAMVQTLAERYKAIPADLWGEQGTPAIESDSFWVNLFEARTNLTAAQVVNALRSKLSQEGNSAFNQKLLNVIAKTINPKLTVRYVTPATADTQVMERGADRARGWYVSKNTDEAIYVLSPDFVHSGLTTETLLHELVHGALAKTVQAELDAKAKNPKYTSDALELVQELDTLRLEAKKYADANGLTDYAPALLDVQELIAWGMTNQGFQQNVLNKITMESKTSGNRLVRGMQAFINAITKLLFRDTSKANTNGVGILVTNVSGLFFEAAQVKSPVDVVLNQQGPAAMDQINEYTTTQVYDALDSNPVSPEFDAQLRDLLGTIVAKLHGPFGAYKDSMKKDQALSAKDSYLKAINTSTPTFSSKANASGFVVRDQESFVIDQLEATIRSALEDNTNTTSTAYKELTRLYQEARRNLKPAQFHNGDWVITTPAEKQAAQAKYDFLFAMEPGPDGRLDYVSRFTAMGMANEDVNNLLKVKTEPTAKAPASTSLADRIRKVVDDILTWFSDRVTKTYSGQNADEKLQTLMGVLVDIDAKKKAALIRRGNATLTAMESAMQKGSDTARGAIAKAAGSSVIKNSSNPFVRAAGSLTKVVVEERFKEYMAQFNVLRDKHFTSVPGTFAKTVNYVLGAPELIQEHLRMAVERDRQRKEVNTYTSKMALDSFATRGKAFTKEAKTAITAMMLRTNAQALLDKFSMQELADFSRSAVGTKQAITKYETDLAAHPKFDTDMIDKAKFLAYYMVTGENKTGQKLMLNTYNIANMFGTIMAGFNTQDQVKELQAMLDPLVSLYALTYSPSKYRADMAQVFDVENNRGDKGNGVKFALMQHRELLNQSNERLFDGAEALRIQGYLPDITNPNVDIQVVDDVRGKELMNRGYKQGMRVERDIHDPDLTEKRMYVLTDGGLRAHPSGIFSNTSMQKRGTSKGQINNVSWAGMMNGKVVQKMDAQKSQPRAAFDPTMYPGAVKENFAVPLVNSQGEVVNYRYTMKEDTKDTVMERENRFEHILGTMAGNTFDKETTATHNHKAVQMNFDLYKANYAERPESYMEVGPNSPSAELREIWRLLPDATKASAKEIWGREGMMIRNDLLDINFGYRKFSISTMFDTPEDQRNFMQTLAVNTVEGLLAMHGRAMKGMTATDADNYSKRAGLLVRRGEDIWQEVIRETKDIIVVKTGIVLLGNIHSNMTVLAMNGVSAKNMLRDHNVALKGALAYRQDNAELFRLQNALDTGYVVGSTAAGIQRQIAVLKDAIARNPVAELIEAGLMPTIVEDLSQEEDTYSYKTRFVRKTEGVVSKMNPGVVKAAKFVYMSKDSTSYKLLSQTTQLSDFVARYVLHKHLTTRKVNPLTGKEAIQKASEAFVNYDIPMPKGLQYMDDMGFLPFTKYFLSIQRVLAGLARDNPGRVMMTLMANNYFDLMPTVMDSSIWTRIGNNPLYSGALRYPGTLDELATVNAGLSIFK